VVTATWAWIVEVKRSSSSRWLSGRCPVHPLPRTSGAAGLSVYWRSTSAGIPASYGDRVDNQAEVREFLRTRRARVTPQRAGIIGGGRRRVTGLRREEVATPAGVSSDYYAKMERGTLSVSPRRSSARSPARCNSTRPRPSTCTTWPAPPGRRPCALVAAPRRRPSAPRCNGCSTPSPAHRLG
jgi:hypothetical protein